jgi:hypothetical protein
MMKNLGQVIRDLTGWPEYLPVEFHAANGERYAVGKIGIGKYDGEECVIIKEAE